jgi:hypothetical protein
VELAKPKIEATNINHEVKKQPQITLETGKNITPEGSILKLQPELKFKPGPVAASQVAKAETPLPVGKIEPKVETKTIKDTPGIEQKTDPSELKIKQGVAVYQQLVASRVERMAAEQIVVKAMKVEIPQDQYLAKVKEFVLRPQELKQGQIKEVSLVKVLPNLATEVKPKEISPSLTRLEGEAKITEVRQSIQVFQALQRAGLSESKACELVSQSLETKGVQIVISQQEAIFKEIPLGLMGIIQKEEEEEEIKEEPMYYIVAEKVLENRIDLAASIAKEMSAQSEQEGEVDWRWLIDYMPEEFGAVKSPITSGPDGTYSGYLKTLREKLSSAQSLKEVEKKIREAAYEHRPVDIGAQPTKQVTRREVEEVFSRQKFTKLSTSQFMI